MQRRKLVLATTGGALAISALLLGSGGAAAAGGYGSDHDRTVHTRLNALNNSGVSGKAKVYVKGQEIKVRYHARGLAADLPHAVHIHHGEEATHECPTVADDTNRDFRLNVVEGLPRYGPIAVSLTTRGDTSPTSALAVDRFSTAPDGKIHYKRTITTSRTVARAIQHGEGVVVVHGVDYNNNGRYDFDGAGRSELDRNLPAEATDPAACGVLR